MGSALAGAAAAGIELAGGIISNAQGAHQAFKNRDLIRQLSKTQYQRAVADMKAAGLNPALAYQQGGNAAGGGGGSSDFENLGEGALKGAAAAASLSLLKAQTLDVTSAAKLKDKQAEAVDQTKMIELADWQGKNPSTVNPFSGELEVDNHQWGALQRRRAIADLANVIATKENIAAGTAKQRAEAQLVGVEAQAKRLGIPKARAWSQFWQGINTGVDWVKDSFREIQHPRNR